MRQRKGALIIWPAYIDSKLTRSQGRKIPANLGIPNITVKVLRAAAEAAGFEAEIEPDKKYPSAWHKSSGYLVLQNPEGHKKKRILLMLAKSVRRLVAQKKAALEEAKKKGKGKRKRGRR